MAAQAKWDIDMATSGMVGDKAGDMQAAVSAGVGTRILVGMDGLACPQAISECTHTAKNLLDAVKLITNKDR